MPDNSIIYKNQENTPVKENSVILHQSIFIIIFRIMTLELFFDFLYSLLRIPELYFNLSPVIKIELIPYYFVVFVFFSLVKMIILLVITLRWITVVYEIRKQEIIFKTGILKVHVNAYSCAHMQEVSYNQSLFGRILNYGSVEIYSPSIEGNIILKNIPAPRKYQSLIEKELIEEKSVGYKP